MKIGQPDIPSVAAQAAAPKQPKTAAAPAAETAAKSATSASAAGVPVTFSSSAKALDQTSRATSEFDASKVKAVKTAIENGTFTIDAEAIADKLLSNAQEVLVRTDR